MSVQVHPLRALRFAALMQLELDTPLDQGGSALSVGQRQLLCMARALLKKATILLIDEATSNVDHVTDAHIQSTIRSAFADVTVLTIAHRINTIIDSDKVLVLSDGAVSEFDSPSVLLARPGSTFAALVQDMQTATAMGSKQHGA